jgi:rhodanese-related sulfurtransferase
MPETIDTERVQKLLGSGAQLVDVLPAETYAREHLPGAVNIPLAEIGTAADRLDRSCATIVYCFDYQCDLSPRAAARLAQLGFSEVYDYTAGRVAWLAEGLPGDGLVGDDERVLAVTRADVARVGPAATVAEMADVIGDWEVVVVVSDDGVVAGLLRAEAVAVPGDVPVAEIMQSAPPTVRPSITQRELAESMDANGERHVLVTTLSGALLGLVRREELRAA